MPSETLAPPSRLNKTGHLWLDDRPFAEALAAALIAFQAKYNGAVPVSVYCGDVIPDHFEADGMPVWYDGAVGEHCYWLEFPEGMDGRAV